MTEETNAGTTDAATADAGRATTGTTDAGAPDEAVLAPDRSYLEGRGYTVGSFVMAVLAILVIPPLHGIIGAVLGYIGHHKGDSLGRTAMFSSLAAMLVGSIVAAFALGSVT